MPETQTESWITRRGGRTDNGFQSDVSSGTENQNMLLTTWITKLNVCFGRELAAASRLPHTKAIRDMRYDAGDADLILRTKSQGDWNGRIEVEANPWPGSWFRLKQRVFRKCKREKRPILLLHKPDKDRCLWRVFGLAEIDAYLKYKFVTNDPHYKGKRPGGPFNGEPGSAYIPLNFHDFDDWVSLSEMEPIETTKAHLSKMRQCRQKGKQ
jgi:hypothetical protein